MQKVVFQRSILVFSVIFDQLFDICCSTCDSWTGARIVLLVSGRTARRSAGGCDDGGLYDRMGERVCHSGGAGRNRRAGNGADAAADAGDWKGQYRRVKRFSPVCDGCRRFCSISDSI